MRASIALAFLTALFSGFPRVCFGAAAKGAGLPKNPRQILEAAAPFYDLTSPSMKPWHFVADYRLYSDIGKPAEKGVFEYWWESPGVYRETWSRPDATRTDWHTADGKHLFVATGKELGYFEYALPEVLLSPIPDPGKLKPADFWLERTEVTFSHLKFPCVLVGERKGNQTNPVPLINVPTYCFEREKPVLRASTFNVAQVQFNDIAMIRGRYYMARSVAFAYRGHMILSAMVNEVTDLSPNDAAIKPLSTAKPAPDEFAVGWSHQLAGKGGKLVKKVGPVYPPGFKEMGKTGTVLLEGRIGIDGRISDLQVVVGASPALNASAVQAVSRWRYEPIIVNGKSVEAETLIRVIYTLGPPRI